MIGFLLALQMYIPTLAKDRGPEVLMSGSWVSCPLEDSADYAEKAYKFKFKERVMFTLHLGERDEFALFAGDVDDIPHDSPLNLLGPAFHYNDLPTVAGGRNWSSAALGVHLNVIAIPPSREECYAYIIRMEKDASPVWANR